MSGGMGDFASMEMKNNARAEEAQVLACLTISGLILKYGVACLI